jgi:hypothetical protein
MSKLQGIEKKVSDSKLLLAQELTRAALLAAYEAGSSTEVLDLLLDALRELADEAPAEVALAN